MKRTFAFLASLRAAVACLVMGLLPGWVHAAEPPTLLIYCGITMVRPMTELARSFERNENVRILISQGGSEDLYQSARKSRQGDLYLPGEPSYRDRHLSEGLLGDYKVIGYNQMALFVQKGNPKKVRPDIRQVLRKDLALLMGNADSGSIGREAMDILRQAGIYDQAVAHAAMLLPDSRSLSLTMKRGEGDVALSWRATAFFEDNAPYLEVVDLDTKVAKPQALLLNLLTFSKHPEIARRFIDYVASPAGQAVFRKYGFLDNKTKL